MPIPDTIQTVEELRIKFNREISRLENRLKQVERGKIKLLAPLNANGFPIENLPGPQRDPRNAITQSAAEILPPILHGGTHQNGGVDEIAVDGLTGLLADRQTPILDDILMLHLL